jgi:hypothetical protein
MKLRWPEVQEVAEQFLPFLESSYREYVDEMQGLANGAGLDLVERAD